MIKILSCECTDYRLVNQAGFRGLRILFTSKSSIRFLFRKGSNFFGENVLDGQANRFSLSFLKQEK